MKYMYLPAVTWIWVNPSHTWLILVPNPFYFSSLSCKTWGIYVPCAKQKHKILRNLCCLYHSSPACPDTPHPWLPYHIDCITNIYFILKFNFSFVFSSNFVLTVMFLFTVFKVLKLSLFQCLLVLKEYNISLQLLPVKFC